MSESRIEKPAPYDHTLNWYPEKITAWEMRHGIFRTERNGMLYIGTHNLEKTCASIDREAHARRAADAAFAYHEAHQPPDGRGV